MPRPPWPAEKHNVSDWPRKLAPGGRHLILDEPTIGLHQRDNDKLIATIVNLRDLGNTVLVVEHDEHTILAADHVIDVGPGAGEHGGEIVALGTPEEVMRNAKSITGQYLAGIKRIDPPAKTRPGNKRFIKIVGAQEFNLKKIDVQIPLGMFVAITGVSGSGVDPDDRHLARALNQHFYNSKDLPGKHTH